VNDESSHGPQRWHFVNARNIRELIGNGTLGGPIMLTNQAYGFPSGVTGRNGNQSAALFWSPVASATSYNVRCSTVNGGPYNIYAGKTTNTSFYLGGLTNGQTYYFAITATQGGAEGTPSEQLAVTPFDTSQNVFCAGSMSEGGQFTPVVDVSPSAAATGQPSYVGSEQYTGVLNPRELDYYGYGNLENENVGGKGYVIYDWRGYGSQLTNIASPITITTGSGWTDFSYLERQCRIGTNLGANDGLVGNPIGSISVQAGDTNFHFLTVLSPAQFNNPRQFILRLSSTNGASAAFTINEALGFSHVFQFLFRGNATLSADGTAGSGAIVQALFLDDALVDYSSTNQNTPVPPTGLHILPR
jgi:hypothetical protein